MTQPPVTEDSTVNAVHEEIIRNIPTTDAITREVAREYARLLGGMNAEQARATCVEAAFHTLSHDQMAQAMISAVALLVDEQEAHAKTMSNFEEYADSRGDGVLVRLVEGLEALVEEKEQAIGNLAVDVIEARAEVHKAGREIAHLNVALEQAVQDRDERLTPAEHSGLAKMIDDLRGDRADVAAERDMLRDELRHANATLTVRGDWCDGMAAALLRYTKQVAWVRRLHRQDRADNTCIECTAIAGKPVAYPCPTAQGMEDHGNPAEADRREVALDLALAAKDAEPHDAATVDHSECHPAGQDVKCDRCGREYVCTPFDDFYCAAEGDHCCESCLTGGRPIVHIDPAAPLDAQIGES